MGEMVGAAPEQLEQLALAMGRSSKQLEQTASALRSQVHSCPWRGRDAVEFKDSWDSQYERSLREVAAVLENAQGVLRSEAQQQTQASSGDSGSTNPSGVPDFLSMLSAASSASTPVANAWKRWTDAGGDSGFATVGAAIGFVSTLGQNSSTTGRYTNAWRSVMNVTGGGDFLRFKSSPILQSMKLGGLSDLMAKNPALHNLGTASGYMSILGDGASAIDKARSGDVSGAIHGGVDVVADGVKTSKDPVTYLSGVALSVWNFNIQEAQNINWNPDAQTRELMNPFHGDNFSKVYLGIENPSTDKSVYAGQVLSAVGEDLWNKTKIVSKFF